MTDNPMISCSPPQLDFGLNAVGISSTLSVLCTNIGQDLPGHPAAKLFIPDPGSGDPGLTIQNGDVSFEPAFDEPFPVAGLAPGQSTKVDVTYAPIADGTHSDTLIISSNDSVSPRTSVPLLGRAKFLPGCDFTINPPNGLAFGHVDRGNDAVLPLEVVDNGIGDCGPITAELEPGSCPDFSLIGPSGPTTSLTLPLVGSSSAEIDVSYAPTTNHGTCTATLCIDFPSRPGTPFCFTLTGSSLPGCLLVKPPQIDFGTLSFDAATGGWTKSDKQTVTILNICDAYDVQVNSISVVDPAMNQGTPQPEFFLSGDPTPVTVPRVCSMSSGCPPPAPVSFQVSFEPHASGKDTAKVAIFTDDLSDPYVVPLKGMAE